VKLSCFYYIRYISIFMEATSFCYLLNKINIFRRTQHNFILIAFYMNATCFGPFSGHHQACQYKNHLKEVTMKYNVSDRLFTVTVFLQYENIEHKIYKI
jgi:hypothetical protein